MKNKALISMKRYFLSLPKQIAIQFIVGKKKGMESIQFYWNVESL